jgi:hypothetical protein
MEEITDIGFDHTFEDIFDACNISYDDFMKVVEQLFVDMDEKEKTSMIIEKFFHLCRKNDVALKAILIHMLIMTNEATELEEKNVIAEHSKKELKKEIKKELKKELKIMLSKSK